MEPLFALWPTTDVPSQCISLYQSPEVFLKDYAAAPPVHQVIFATYWLQSEVLNGGLGQFFGNDTGVLAPEAVDACKVLNMPRLAAKLQEAMGWFGSPYPRQRELRETKLDSAVESGVDPFDKLDGEVVDLIYEEGAGLEDSALAFVNAHASHAQ